MSKTIHGTIEVTAGSTSYTLKPSLRAVRSIEGRFGGLLPAIQIVGSANLGSIAFIIAAGSAIDTGKRKELEAVEEAVFEGGVDNVGAQVLPFLRALLNPAGRTKDELEKEAESGNE
jgi:hypothetical protein